MISQPFIYSQKEPFGVWVDALHRLPTRVTHYSDFKNKPYVLAVDGRGRMSIGYVVALSTGEHKWVFAKPIGVVTHWMPLPEPPKPL